MRRIARLTLAAALSAALAAPTAATFAADAGPPGPARPSDFWARLLGPFQALFGSGDANGPGSRTVAAGTEEDNGPANDPDGLTGGAESEPNGSNAGSETESDGGPNHDPDG